MESMNFKPKQISPPGGLHSPPQTGEERLDPLSPQNLEVTGDALLSPIEPPKQLLTTGDSEDEQYSRPCLSMGVVALLTAAGGTGKTRALCQLAVSVATGIPWLGAFNVASPGRVALLCGEETKSEILRRIQAYLQWGERAHGWKRDMAIRAAHGLALGGLAGAIMPPMSEIGDKLNASLRDGETFSLVILDPAIQFMGPDSELDSHAANGFIVDCRRLANSVKGNPTVLIAHHTRKGGGGASDDARGSSAIRDGARWQMALTAEMKTEGGKEKPSGVVIARVVKNNYGPMGEDIRLKFTEGGVIVPAPSQQPTASRGGPPDINERVKQRRSNNG
jgi:RecA-family ATPase